MINFEEYVSKPFEISLVVRNALGQPTGRRRTYATDSPYKLWQFYMRHRGKPRRKKQSNNKGTAT